MLKEFGSLVMVPVEMTLSVIRVYHSNSCKKEKKYFIKNMKLTHSNCH